MKLSLDAGLGGQVGLDVAGLVEGSACISGGFAILEIKIQGHEQTSILVYLPEAINA